MRYARPPFHGIHLSFLPIVYQPIRTPGAIQVCSLSYGKMSKKTNFLVHQVSENSTELLGFPPHYLFSLACFTDVLPDSQAAILWDSIQYLADPDEDSPSEGDLPHVFLLRGWGMPGSALLSDDPEEPQHRRAWSCWCATHRPKIVAGTTGSLHTTCSTLCILRPVGRMLVPFRAYHHPVATTLRVPVAPTHPAPSFLILQAHRTQVPLTPIPPTPSVLPRPRRAL